MKIINEKESVIVNIRGGKLKTIISPQSTDAKNALIGTLELKPGYRMPEGEQFSCHKSEEFSYIIKGKLRVWSDGVESILEEGDCIFNAPQKKHWCKAEGEESVKLVWVLSPPEDLRNE